MKVGCGTSSGLHPVVLDEDRAQHAVWAQACCDALEDERQALTRLLRLGQHGEAFFFQRLHLVGHQLQIAHWRQQFDLDQVLGQKPHQVFGVARGMGRSHGHFAAITCRLRAHGVMAPAQGEGSHA
jgi:hypothetical protein